MKLSFIIPLYNAEAYIGKCLDSILESDIDHKEYEIIVIDDGSKDNGQAVVRQYVQKYENIKLFVQENKGQSVARNYGIREALGKYIWFVDSDDYVDAKNISAVLDMMDDNDIEICKFEMQVYHQDGSTHISKKKGVTYNKILTGEETFLQNCTMGSVCDGFFSREFIIDNNLSFLPGIIHQDSEFSIRSTALAKKIIFIGNPLYVYRYNDNSCTRSVSFNKKQKSHISDAVIAKSISQFSIDNKYISDGTRDYLKKYVSSIVKGRLYSYLRTKDYDSKILCREFIQKAESLGVYPIAVYNPKLKETLLIRFLNNKSLMTIAVNLRNLNLYGK